jgi:hypothetical protein
MGAKGAGSSVKERQIRRPLEKALFLLPSFAKQVRDLLSLSATTRILQRRSRQIDHPYEDAYDLFVPHGRASHERASDWRVSHGRVSLRRVPHGRASYGRASHGDTLQE